MILPAFHDAKDDHALRGSPMTVYLYLLDELSPVQWREVKQVALVARLGYSERTIRDALDVLAERGYLERDESPANAGTSRRFRLVYSREQLRRSM